MCSSLCWGTTSGWMTPLGNQRNSGPWSFLGSYNQHVSLAQGPVWSAREGTMDDWRSSARSRSQEPFARLKVRWTGVSGQPDTLWCLLGKGLCSVPFQEPCLQHQITIVVHRCWGDNLLWTIDCDVPDGGPIVFSFSRQCLTFNEKSSLWGGSYNQTYN